jgi:hypothetical protein
MLEYQLPVVSETSDLHPVCAVVQSKPHESLTLKAGEAGRAMSRQLGLRTEIWGLQQKTQVAKEGLMVLKHKTHLGWGALQECGCMFSDCELWLRLGDGSGTQRKGNV